MSIFILGVPSERYGELASVGLMCIESWYVQTRRMLHGGASAYGPYAAKTSTAPVTEET